MTDLAVDILGPLRVSRAGAAVPLGAARQQALLALLALHPAEAVPADRLVEELWDGSAPETASKIVQIYVSELRKALGRDAIATRGGGYALELDPERIDARRFEQLAAAGAHREALGLWRGPALADFRYERWAQAEAQRLEELRVAVLEDRIDADLAAGRHAALAGELEALVAEHPLRERLRGQQILALYRSGRQAEALAAYREARRALVEELGIEPSQQLRRLEQAILAQDTSLDGGARARAASAQDRDRRLGGVGRGRRSGGPLARAGSARPRRSSGTAAASSGTAAGSRASSGSRSSTRTTRCGRCGQRRSCARPASSSRPGRSWRPGALPQTPFELCAPRRRRSRVR